jgi:zinc transport system ATP-binding protein
VKDILMSSEPVITLRDVWFSYDGPPVLESVNLDIPSLDFVCVIGPNGGGKTTLLKLMLGLIEPSCGSVQVLGQSPIQVRARVGYMPQHAQLDPRFPASVMDVVLTGRLGRTALAGPYRRIDKEVAARVLEEVGLADARSRALASLSGGQRQRVLIARALACEPELLLLDEPTANLDSPAMDDLYTLLHELHQRLTVIMVSHDVGFVSVFFKTAICVNRTVHTHPTRELTSQSVADVYGREVRFVHKPAGDGHRAEP